MKEVDNNNKKTNPIDPARFIVEDEKSFFFASVFSLTKRMWKRSDSLSNRVCFFFFGINANICIVKHKLLSEQ